MKIENTLIKEVLDKIDSQNKDISSLKIVLPSKRAIIFFKKELKKKYSKGVYFLDIITIEDLMCEISGLNKIDNISLLFQFYEVYKNIEKNKADDFINFIKWANVFLSDINEINLHTETPNKIIEYLIDVDRIQEWNPSDMDSNLVKNYIGYWKKAKEYFLALNKYLVINNIGYQGLIFRTALEKIKEFKYQRDIIFVGFNALTYCEEMVINFFLKEGRSSIFWDTDKYYMDNQNHEAGLFIRRYKNWNYYNSNEFLFKNDYIKERKNVHLYGMSGNTNQALCINYVLDNKILRKSDDISNTAVILADENILLSVLNSIPSSIENFNITMEFPLKNLAIAQFFRDIIEMYSNRLKLNISKGYFYYKDVLSVFRNSFVISFFSIDKIVNNINNINDTIISKNQILEIFKEEKNKIWIEYIFTDIKDSSVDLVDFINNLIKAIVETKKDGFSNIEKEYLYHFSKIFSKIKNIHFIYNTDTNIEFLKILYNQVLVQETIPFVGEPLEGIQIMGMLETRLLDFKNIIISSVNEGILPEGKTDNSYIPYDIKKEFKIPTYDDKDAIFSYHFYRLLQRAENIYLIYNSKEDYLGSGEDSRFIKQIEFELKDNYNIIKEFPFSGIAENRLKKDLEIVKDDNIIDKMKEVFSRKLSPSAINLYLKDEIEFYKKYVLGIYETENKKDIISPVIMGDIIHETLVSLYEPFIGNVIKLEHIDFFSNDYENVLNEKIEQKYKGGNHKKGKNILVKETIHYYLKKFFLQEKKMLKEKLLFKIEKLEQEYNKEIFLEDIGNINLFGKIDRIDILDQNYRIIDYKTGEVDIINLDKKEKLTIETLTKKPQTFQLLFYKYIVEDKYKNSYLYIYSFKNNEYKKQLIKNDFLYEFEDILKKIIEDMFDKKIPFRSNNINKKNIL